MAFLTKFHVKILIILFAGAYGLKMIPKDLKVEYTNDKYVEDVVLNIRRFSRNGDYVLNLSGKIKHMWGNNITVNIIITEFLHNEYRRSFIEFHYRFCDLINKEPMFGEMLRMKGVVCPAVKGEYRLMNMTVQSHSFPNLWPFEKGGADINVTTTDSGELIAMGYVHVLFKQPKKP